MFIREFRKYLWKFKLIGVPENAQVKPGTVDKDLFQAGVPVYIMVDGPIGQVELIISGPVAVEPAEFQEPFGINGINVQRLDKKKVGGSDLDGLMQNDLLSGVAVSVVPGEVQFQDHRIFQLIIEVGDGRTLEQ